MLLGNLQKWVLSHLVWLLLLISFLLSEVNITVEKKEFNIQKAMIREIKRYQKEVHGKF